MTSKLVRTLLVALGCVVGTALVAAPGAAVAQSNPLGPVKITHDRMDDVAIAAGAPVVFTATGSISPHAGESTSWLVFKWDFGDGATAESGTLFGSESIGHLITNVFIVPGVYTVRCTAGHGPENGGRFKFEKSKTLKVTVSCAETALGPKQCGPVAFKPFTGTWSYNGNERDIGTLTLVDGDRGVTGTLFVSQYHIVDGYKSSNWTVDGSGVTFKSGRDDEGQFHRWVSLVADLKPAGGAAATAPKSAKARPPQILLQLRYDEDTNDYRLAYGAIQTATGFTRGAFRLDERLTDRKATICTQLNAGRKKTRPGGLLAFTVAVQNEGPACLPTGRIGLAIEVEGATIIEQSIQHTRLSTAGSDERHLIATLFSLGKGKKADGRAALAFVVQTDDDAGEVKCRVQTIANGADPYADIVVPTERVICVPVEGN
jgi:hypothetical protein